MSRREGWLQWTTYRSYGHVMDDVM